MMYGKRVKLDRQTDIHTPQKNRKKQNERMQLNTFFILTVKSSTDSAYACVLCRTAGEGAGGGEARQVRKKGET